MLVLLALLLAAAPAHAGVAAVEGTEVVYRGDAGRDAFYAEGTTDAVTFRGDGVTAGPGCSGQPVVCSGATALRVIAGAGDDDVSVSGPLPVIVDLGPGADEFDTVLEMDVRPQAMTLAAGDGDDDVGVAAHTASVDLGPGKDDLQIDSVDREKITGPFVVNGGPGDDDLFAASAISGGPIDWVCGAGRDDVWAGARDRVGAGCAHGVTGLVERMTIGTYARGRLALRAGTLSAAATLAIRVQSLEGAGNVLARDRYRARGGTVRRTLRVHPVRSPRVEATFTTIRRGERTRVIVEAQITRR